MSRRSTVLSLVSALALGASLLGASPAIADSSGALYVTQREPGASANVASFTIGAFDGSLSSPIFAGSGGAASFGIAVTPDGAHVYVTNDNGGSSISQYSVAPGTGALTPLSPATVATSVAAGAEPEDIAVDPSGRWVYVANPAAGSVSQLRIDPATGALTMVSELQSALISSPTGVAFSPDGHSLYVADFGAANIVEFDVDADTGSLRPKSDAVAPLPQPSGGSMPQPRRLVTATVAGSDYLYVSDYANAQVDEFTIDPASGELSGAAGVASDANPTGLAVDTDSTPASLYVAAEGAGTVDEYDIDSTSGAPAAKASPSITAGSGPDGVALAPDGQELYVGDSGDTELNLYAIGPDGTLAPDATNAQVAAGSGPSTPVVHALPTAAFSPPTPTAGALTQLPAPDDCLTGNPFGCNTLIAPAGALSADYQTVVSPDGKDVYAAAFLGVLAEFRRDPNTGALTDIGCVSDGSSGCDEAAGSNNPRSLALSPDGAYLYEVGAENDLTIFSRDPSTGRLTWIGCLSSPDSEDSRCTAADGLHGPNSVAVSPDGTSVYVTSGDESSIAWFTRDPATGLLTQPDDNCISSDSEDNPASCPIDSANGLDTPLTIAISPDSRNVYVSAGGLGPGGDVAEFSRNLSTGALTQLPAPHDCLASPGTASCANTTGVGFGGEEDIAISPDGRSVYLNSFNNSAVIELTRDPDSGALASLPAPNDCITSDSSNPGGCGDTSATALNGIQGVAVSPDGLDVYASSSGPVTAGGAFNAVDEFHRDPVTGALTQAAAPFGCLTENGSGCDSYNVNGLGQPRRLAVSPDGTNVYVAGQDGTLVELARALPSANLSLGQSGAAAAANVGDHVTYTYTIANLGPSTADDPVLSVPLDSEESLAGSSPSQGSCSGSAPVRCDLGPLPSGDAATVTVTANADASGTASVDATVADGSDVTDPDSSDNDVTTSTVISELAPANNGAPEITGTASAGQTLTASTGSWSGSPSSFSYDWEDCSDNSGNGCESVQSGDSDQYTLAPTDDGAFVEVIVTATNTTGNGEATSATVGPVTGAPQDSSLPAITGSEISGATLSASPGTWLGYPSPAFSYDWQRCPDTSGDGCSSMQSGASDQYALSSADEGHFIRVVVTASNVSGPDASATSDQTAVIEGSPAHTALPSISGIASAGDSLTASPGAWSGYPAPSFSYDWEACPDNSGVGCSSVQSGASDQLMLSGADAGLLVRVTVTATNGVGSDASATSDFTDAVTQAPSNTVPPSISGTASSGDSLTASPGAWSGYPAPTLSYDWEACPDNSGNGCSSVQSSASDQLTLNDSDAGLLVRVTVTATNGVSPDASAISDFTDAVTQAPMNSAAPAITGTAALGESLQASTGTWSGYPAPLLSYTWQDCPDSSGENCSTIAGAVSNAYLLATSDEGSTVRVLVKASNNVGSDVTVASATTAPVTGAPADISPPAISGSAIAGQSLTASTGNWSGYPDPSFTYTWEECPDSSATGCSTVQTGGSQYALNLTDEGRFIRVTVTASNAIDPDSSATSALVGPITGAPANNSAPAITGTVNAGQTLTATPGGWSGYPPPSFNYDFEACPDNSGNGCSSVQSGGASQYTLQSADEGKLVRVVVTASNDIGSNATAPSSFTSAVTGSPANSAIPTISGSAIAGQTLNALPGTWSAYPAPGYSYDWEDCPDSSGNGCSTVQSGASSQYPVTSSDEGSRVRVVVTASNHVGADASAASATTSIVTGAPVNSSAPSISGTASAGQTLTASTGVWSANPAPSFSYQWQHCPDNSGNGCSTLQTGASNQYALVASDEGLLIRVIVTATNSLGHPSATTAFTAAVSGPPVNSAQPAVTGTAIAGQTLHASTGTWSGYPAPSFTYTWQDCPDSSGNGCSTISGAVSNSYVLAATDEGSTVRVRVKASNGVGSDVTVASPTTASVTGAPANSTPPSISGTASAGQTLSVSPGTWTATPPASFSYSWQACPDSSGNGCSIVQSGIGSQYTLQAADEGSLVRVVVTASNGIGSNGTAPSAFTAAVTGPPLNNGSPTISGTATSGQTLTASHGTWGGFPAPGFSYAWQDCVSRAATGCSTVQSGASNQYLLSPGDAGSFVRVVVTASNGIGSNATAPSTTSAAVAAPPLNGQTPAISGTAQQGIALSGSAGTWSGFPAPALSYQWEDCDSGGGNCAPVAANGNSLSYTPTSVDVGQTLVLSVTGTNSAGHSTAASAASAAVLIAPPSISAAPLITGTAEQGDTLSASTGTWTNSPTSFTYAWMRCDAAANNCTPITGATASSYVASGADVNSTLRVTVTASNAGGPGSATSSPTAAVLISPPVPTLLPVITGTTGQGQLLSTSNGLWINSPTSFGYQWQQCDADGNNCANIANATTGNYVVQTGDVGDTLRVVVTAFNAGGNNSVTSAQSSVVGTRPVNTALPVLSGVAQQGQALSVSDGSWSATPAPTFTYAWLRCDAVGAGCTAIAGATDPAYTPVAADIGHTLRAAVTAANTAGSATSTSAQTTPIVIAAPANSAAPAVSGAAQPGQTLSASPGAWNNSPSAYIYQWAQCDPSGNACSPIAGATAPNYVVGPGDVGHTLRVTVTASNTGGSDAAVSPQSQVISSMAPANASAPAISGAAQVGKTLTASNGSWSNSPTSFSYQWQRCDAAGNACSAIAAATAATYVAASADLGRALRVSVTAANSSGSTAATSAQTATVGSPQASLAAPILGKTTNLAPVSGTVLVRVPGSKTFVKLTGAVELPLGSTIDARHGKVTLTVGLSHGLTQTGQFYDGEFTLTQTSTGMTVLTLAGGSYAGCPAPSSSATTDGGASTGATTSGGATVSSAPASSTKQKPTTVVRQLWGNAHGEYTTKGRYGSAAVSGTVWLTQDRCDGTYIKVTKDNVIAVAYAHPHTKHNIKQGHHILITAPVH